MTPVEGLFELERQVLRAALEYGDIASRASHGSVVVSTMRGQLETAALELARALLGKRTGDARAEAADDAMRRWRGQ